MAKFRTGTRNLLAATPTLLLLAFSSLCFIPLSHQADEYDIETALTKVESALNGSSNVIQKLSDLKNVYHGLRSISIAEEAQHFLVDKALTVIRGFISTSISIVLEVDGESPVLETVKVDFMGKDDNKVKVDFRCGTEKKTVEITKLTIVDLTTIFSDLNAKLKETSFASSIKEAWTQMLSRPTIFGFSPKIVVDLPSEIQATSEDQYHIKLSPQREIWINERYLECALVRVVFASVENNGDLHWKFRFNFRTSIQQFKRPADAGNVIKKAFWDDVKSHYKNELSECNRQENNENNTAFLDALPFETEENGLTVKTVLKKAGKLENGNVQILVTSTYTMADNANGVNVEHLQEFSSLCFCSPPVKEDAFKRRLVDAESAINRSSDVLTKLSDIRNLYHGLRGINITSEKAQPLVAEALTVINECISTSVVTNVGDQFEVLETVKVDFMGKDDNKVKVDFRCGTEKKTVEITKLKIVDPHTIFSELNAEMIKTFLPLSIRTTWTETLGYAAMFGDNPKIVCDPRSEIKVPFSDTFELKLSPNEIVPIKLSPELSVSQTVTAHLLRKQDSTLVFTFYFGSNLTVDNIHVVLGLDKTAFWEDLRTTFEQEISGALVDPHQTAFIEAVKGNKTFETKVNGSTVNTVLTKADNVADGKVELSFISTVHVPGNADVVKVSHRKKYSSDWKKQSPP
eukprot:GHVS01059649.1.p1 GENE.GHVS01059649.1~~GHVS01059649.1.p1  ORF type:complete len:689 (-),score=41.94 GHVS01059649.1:516-2582(-)